MNAILTGPMHAGKTSQLRALASLGYVTFPEAETPYVQALQCQHGSEETKRIILADYTGFKAIVSQRQASIDALAAKMPFSFRDRASPCWIAYCRLRNAAVPPQLYELARNETAPVVFFLERLSRFSERRNTGRFATASDADALGPLIMAEYQSIGIEPKVVPEFSTDVEKSLALRTACILDHIERSR